MRGLRKNQRKTLTILFFLFAVGIGAGPGFGAEERIPKMGQVRINAHPGTLEGMTVLLRWNGKYNGDKFLSRVGELLVEQVKNVRIIKMWEVDSNTAIISKKMEVSEQIASKVAALKPNIVISSQAD